MISQHQPAHTMARGDVGRFAGECDLDRCGAPGDERGKLALADAKQRLMDLGSS
jgi:hypothetical protein